MSSQQEKPATAMLAILWTLCLANVIQAQDALPSWNDGAAKQAIVAFVTATTTEGSADLVPAAERIATFDQDGTLWVEHPMYPFVMYALDRVHTVAKDSLSASSSP